MSVDVEDYFQVGAFETVISRASWDSFPARVERNTRFCMDLFEEEGVKATFFTLGWVAERFPGLVREIVERGHELASHGYGHDRVHGFSEQEFREDLRRSRGLLEDAGGMKVRGYRAPSFSIGVDNAWAQKVLAEEGYDYSSSVAPIRSDHYGWPEAPRFPYLPVEGSPMLEIPVSTVEYGKMRFACGGGGFFRLLPYRFSAWAIQRINTADGQAAMFYFHPWEIDPTQPRIEGAPLKSRVRHYTKLNVMADKLRRALRRFSWDRVDRVFLDDQKRAAA
ncbi:polysaccharide deacetylase [Pacificimonas flava]|uniref:Chitooligosaccharide deacetylase n=2 Tax=Pacificimonas TaxID=1960290 RepID=A0A219B8Q8_9SPHN|nr:MULTISPECIES: XrtA system polysaccharide deacetylase [Pacificimonas]MBZ6379999.1 DUF3473 domain-containing protein [Pacificimonas aurantium]OWV34516.1 polysaccharide deacetylase [Pacificimonas flava]